MAEIRAVPIIMVAEIPGTMKITADRAAAEVTVQIRAMEAIRRRYP